jgi:hypothetical protein
MRAADAAMRTLADHGLGTIFTLSGNQIMPLFDAMIDRAELMDLDGIGVCVVTTDDLIKMKEMAAADPGRRRSKALRDQADIELLRGDVPQPDEGW